MIGLQLLPPLVPSVNSAETRDLAKIKDWPQLVEAARQEGTVVLYGPGNFQRRSDPINVFRKAYPDIKVEVTLGSGNEIIPRVLTERRAGRFIPDVIVGGSTNSVIALKPAGAVEPLKPVLMLPEVLDESAWLENRLWWADAAEPLTTLMFLGYVQTMAYVNTKLVDPGTFRSYRDLLDPKWRGKMVSSDIRRGGRGGVVSRFIYKHPQLGSAYLERLYSEMDITLSSDPRQMVDWLASGRFSIALFLATDDITRAQDVGLPVAPVPAEQFKEGSPLAPAGGAVSLMNRARHPNAATLLINWLLSREGQLAVQSTLRLPSLRVDIPKEGLYPFDVPKPGVKYAAGGTEEYSRITSGAIGEVVTRALASAGRR